MNKKSSLLLIVIVFQFITYSCSKQQQSTVENDTQNNEAWLKVTGEKIINQKGDTVYLRGFGLGGMLHMENFINGFPSNEESIRDGLLKVLGREKYDLFFNEFYKNYFTEPDAEYIKSLGLNLIRIPINYRLFEDDMNPGVIKEEAFEHLDRVINLCAKYKIYTIIDLHALPGYQNQGWHSDNPTHKALFWKHKDFQDRVVLLWEFIANRYKNQPWVAGYDLINEPADPTEEMVFPFYKRLYEAIRKIDPNHIMFLEGNRYANDFHIFSEIWDNVVYTNHDYAIPGFIDGGDYPGVSRGQYINKDTVEKDFVNESEFMFKNKVPVWVGEFGPVYTGVPEKDEMRYTLLKDQLANYDKYQVSWCIWLYKDLGLQAILSQDENTPYMKLTKDFQKRKNYLGADAWGSTDENIRQVISPLEDLFEHEFNGYDPFPFGPQYQINRLVRHILISEALISEYCALFQDMSDEQLTELAASFNFKNYNKRERLEKILTGLEK
ncbi:MAG: glycoside hydrolase family 5 protein [Bacteroidales bacterium]|nr:glycoside hydrolase family 5 protein [Bacteroidales bacterium]